jgi:hypothetical protein
MRLRTLPLLTAAGLTALLAAGCSASASPSSGAGSGAGAAPSATQAIQLAAAHAQLATSVTGTVSVTGSGTAAMSMSGTLTEQVRPQLKAEVVLPSVSALGQSVPGGMTEILTGQAVYLRMSVLSELTGGKAWLEVPFSSLGKDVQASIDQLIQQAQDNSPLLQTQLLAGATGVHVVGKATIGGVPVTEYAGSYTMSAAINRLPASLRSQVRQEMSKAGTTSASFTVWLDNQQQVRKLIVTEHGSAESATVSMLVTSINQPVSITLPPASQVAVLPASALSSGSTL